MIKNEIRNRFSLVLNPESLLPIVSTRLPRCAYMYNMIKMMGLFPTEMSFYVLGEIDSDECWILGKYVRDDNVQQFTISIPNDVVEVPEDVEEVFVSVSAEILDWGREFHFLALELLAKEIVFKISNSFGNDLQITPCQYFFMPREQAAQIRVNSPPVDFELKSLNSDEGMKFFGLGRDLNGLELFRGPSRCVQRLPTVGAYAVETGKLVSGARLSPLGHLATATVEGCRRQGLSYLCFQTLIQTLAKETPFIPCSMLDMENVASLMLHNKIGLHPLHSCYCIKFKN